MIPRKTLATCAGLLIVLAASVACNEDPIVRIAKLRVQYEVELTSFVIHEIPLETEVAPEEGADEGADAEGMSEEGMDDEGLDEAGMDEKIVLPEPVPVRSDLLLDILLQNRALSPLPGITVEVIHANSLRAEKARYRVWLETENLAKGSSIQVDHLIEDIDFKQGDAFAVEIRSPIPADEQGSYREFGG